MIVIGQVVIDQHQNSIAPQGQSDENINSRADIPKDGMCESIVVLHIERKTENIENP